MVQLFLVVAAAAKSLQSCPTVCDPIDGCPPGSPIPGLLHARTLDWVAISFSNAWKWKVKVKLLSRVRLFTTAWTAAHQAPPSMGFSKQEYWSGVPLPSPWATRVGPKSNGTDVLIKGVNLDLDTHMGITPCKDASFKRIPNCPIWS